jgi:acetyl/propionyl-CoA carboxylase alpha subunit
VLHGACVLSSAHAVLHRQTAVSRQVVGVPTNIQLIRRILATAAFQRGGVTTSFIEEHTAELMPTGTETAHKGTNNARTGTNKSYE